MRIYYFTYFFLDSCINLLSLKLMMISVVLPCPLINAEIPGVTSSLDRHSTRHSRFLPGRGGGPYIGRFASDHPPLVPSLPNPSIWAMPPNPPPYIPFYPSTTHVENLGSATNSASSSELKQLANNVLNAAPTTHANEITSMEEAGRVTAAGFPIFLTVVVPVLTHYS